jgi:hypothetical protein
MPVHDWTRVDAGTFHHFHCSWVVELSRTLNNGLLPSGYYAMSEQVTSELGPDVLTLERIESEREDAPVASNGPMTVAVAPPQVRFATSTEADPYVRKRRTVAIRHRSGDRVVAVIEIVSPGNKASRNEFRAFVRKAVTALKRGVHLLIVDLHPPSRRDPHGLYPAVWSEFKEEPFELPADKPLTLAAFSTGPIQRSYVETVGVGDLLPAMPLFLTPEEYVNVPLEPTYDMAFRDVPRHLRQLLEAPPA